MGFYNNRSGESNTRSSNTVGGATKFVATVVLSALVGAGATMAVVSSTGRLGSLTSSPTGSVSTVPPVTPTAASNLSSSDWISTVVKADEPSVAAVVNYTNQQSGYGTSSDQASDVGTSVLFEKTNTTGYFVTNNHVVEGGNKVQLVLSSGKKVSGKVVGTDEYTDLAVIAVADNYISGIKPLQFANTNNLQAGQQVVAIGTPEGLSFADSVTSGIISGPKRVMPVEDPNDSNVVYDYQSVIQTDAPINPGNSGGPLLNSNGQVLGINSSKIVATGVENMGFAIPSEEVTQIANEIIQTGHATHTALGISAEDVDQIAQQFGAPNLPVDYGVYVAAVDSSDAKSGGLKQGDIIVAINGQQIQDSADLRTIMFQMKPGSTASLTAYRGRNKVTLKVKVTSLQSPNDTGSAASSQSNSGSGSGYGYGSGSGSDGSSGSGSNGSSPYSGQDPFSFFGGGF